MQPSELLHAGRYRLIRPLGEPGTEATAFLAHDNLLDLDVVCRVGKPGADPRVFRRHYLLLLSANSRGLARPLGYFEEGVPLSPVVVLEHIKGATLEAWAPRRSVAARLAVFEQLAQALASLHAQGLVHGDVHAENALVEGDRVVLIDPNAVGFGSSTGRIPQALTSVTQDVAELARTFRSLFSREELEELRPLPSIVGSRASLAEIRQAVSSLLARPDLLGTDPTDPKKLGRWTAGDTLERRSAFLRTQRARKLAIEGCCNAIENRVRDLAAESGLIYAFQGREGDEAADREEVASADQPMSRLKARTMRVGTPDGDELFIRFEAVVGREFRRPWPFLDKNPSLIDSGYIALNSEHRTLLQQSLEIHYGGGALDAARMLTVVGPNRVPLDLDLISRLVHVLVGWSVPCLNGSMVVPGDKLAPDRWPRDLLLVDGDLDPEFKTTNPLQYLQQRIWILLSTRKGDLALHSDFGSEIVALFNTHRSEIPKLLQSVIEKEIIPDCGQCIDCIEAFEVSRPNPSNQTVEVTVTLWPHGLPRQVWPYKLHFR